MTRKKTTPARTQLRNNSGIEWVGGTVAMPGYVTGEGDPYRPLVLIWMGRGGEILGSAVVRPEEVLSEACESLQSAIDHPTQGSPRTPTRVRVASTELANVLRAGYPDLDVVCAPTPELDRVQEDMRETMGGHGASAPSYLSAKVMPEAMGAFFKAAAGLFRSKPWTLVPDDESLFSVTSEQLGMRDAALSVFGQMGKSFGFILFSSLEEFYTYLDAVEVLSLGDNAEMPPHLVVDFSPGPELAPDLRKEIADHDWEVADETAYPWMMFVDEDCVARPLTDAEVTMGEAIALALTKALATKKKAWLAAWDGGEPLSRTLSVSTHAGKIKVSLRAPCEQEPAEVDASQGLLADFAALPQDDDGLFDHDALKALEGELVKRFNESPEGKGVPEIGMCDLVMDLGANYCGRTIATMGSKDLREVLFTLIPRKVCMAASEAGSIVEELRAFYEFLKRKFGLQQAESCLRLLGPGAEKKLEAAMSDSSNFGMAKSLFSGALNAGFDMQSKAGIDEWAEAMNHEPDLPLAQRPLSKQEAKAKKDKREAARKARKKNR